MLYMCVVWLWVACFLCVHVWHVLGDEWHGVDHDIWGDTPSDIWTQRVSETNGHGMPVCVPTCKAGCLGERDLYGAFWVEVSPPFLQQ